MDSVTGDGARDPAAHRGGIVEVPARRAGRARADEDAEAALRVDDGKGVFVGEVVADEDRRATAERGCARNAATASPLSGVLPPGRSSSTWSPGCAR
jgi:hypothetical protein